MYNQQFQNTTGRYNNTSFGVGAQNQGMQRSAYQPVGAVQSVYGQSQQQQFGGGNPSTEAFHTANYRGNQLGHDQSLRGDSYYPAQQQGGAGSETDYTSFRYGVRGNENAYSSINDVSSQFGFSSPSYSGMNNQMSNQMGNQMSNQMSSPMSNQTFSSMSNQMSNPMSNQMSSRSSFQGGQGYGTGGMSSMGQGQSSYAQNPSAEAFHMANYRGNQEGHDQSLRGDSYYPAQQQGGIANSSMNYGSFRYGVRGNENAYNSINNVAPQFGLNSGGYNMSGQSTFR